MAEYSIISPKYSFVKFNETDLQLSQCCTGRQNFALPIAEEDDLYFQFNLVGSDAIRAAEIMALPLANVQLLLLSGTGNTEGTAVANTLRNWTTADSLTFARYRTEDKGVTYLWRNLLKDIKTLVECDVCFQLAIKVTLEGVSVSEFSDEFSDEFSEESEGTVTLYGFSNNLVRICDTCYTSQLQYSFDEDANGFYHCNGIGAINKARVPMYFSRPQYPEERTVYKKSNGNIKLLKSISSKEYKCDVDFLPDYMHERLKVAIEADNVAIFNDAYSGDFRINSSYDVEWDEEHNLCTAPANFKASVSPYAVRNSNCEDCLPDVQMELLNDTFVPDLEGGTSYIHDVAANDKVYCSPKTYSIESINPILVESASITAEGVLTVVMKAALSTLAAAFLVNYRVTCGNGDTGTASVYGNTIGSGSDPCAMVTGLEVEVIYTPTKAIKVNFDAVVGAVGYQIEIFNYDTLASATYAGFANPTDNVFPRPNGNYQVNVYTDCGGGSYSDPAGQSIVVEDEVAPVEYKYYEGFQHDCGGCYFLRNVVIRSDIELITGRWYRDSDGHWTLLNVLIDFPPHDVTVADTFGFTVCPGYC